MNKLASSYKGAPTHFKLALWACAFPIIFWGAFTLSVAAQTIVWVVGGGSGSGYSFFALPMLFLMFLPLALMAALLYASRAANTKSRLLGYALGAFGILSSMLIIMGVINWVEYRR